CDIRRAYFRTFRFSTVIRKTACAWSICSAQSRTDSKIVSWALPPLMRLVISWRVAKKSSFSARSLVARRTISPGRFMSNGSGATSMPPRGALPILPEHTELREEAPQREEEDRQDSSRYPVAIDRQVFERWGQALEVDDEEDDIERRDRARHEERGKAGDPALGPAEG